MPEPTPPPTPPPAPKKLTRGVINKADAADLNDTEQVVTAAQVTANATALATRGITGALVTTLDADVVICRKQAAQAAQADFFAQKKTKLEEVAKKALLDAMRYFQNAARLKFPNDRDTQHEFFIGQDLAAANRPDLETFCAGLIAKLATETLASRGVTAGEIAALPDQLEAWQDADTDQHNAQRAAEDLRVGVDTLLGTIKARRKEIRLAANLEWPHTAKANATTRKAFGLPPGKPYNG